MGRAGSLVLLAGVAAAATACASPAPPPAGELCSDRARLAATPSGYVSLGVGNGRPRTAVGLGISGDLLRRRDPVEIYGDCLQRGLGDRFDVRIRG